MRYRTIPEETIRRLPMYLRVLLYLQKLDMQYIPSHKLAEFLQLKSPQIRKDLSYFGAFGTRGTGYKVELLIEQIRDILKLNVKQKAALIGAGKLGSAISLYPGFEMFGFEISAIFDTDKKKIGKKIGPTTVEDIKNLADIKNRKIKLAIIAVPGDTAQQIMDSLIKVGVTGILNLSPCYLKAPDNVKVVTIDLAMELGILPYYT